MTSDHCSRSRHSAPKGGDWGRVERGLREVHERSAALLQEIGIKRLSDVVSGERVQQAG